MKKSEFFKDLEELYKLISNNQSKINSFYDILDEKKDYKNKENIDFIENFLKSLDLEITKENKMSVINRLVNLRSDSLKQSLEKEGFSQEEIEKKLEIAYEIVSEFYIKEFEKIIRKIEDRKLLTPFYRELIKGVHSVGKIMTKWQRKWTNHIIYGINRDLFELFDGDEEKIFEMFIEKNLYDLGHNKEIADRSYSALVKNKNGEYEVKAYCDIFEQEVIKIIEELNIFLLSLKKLNDEIFDQKEEWIKYFQNIKEAFLEKDRHKLVKKWANVDRAWMDITTPIQIGHPLEYYEDHYRKAVALEWDIRLANPQDNTDNIISNIRKTYNKYINIIKPVSQETDKIYKVSKQNLNKVQLYIGQPMFFYGAEFDGLFSAQVVPNDEIVSKEKGKKIFAFPDNIYNSAKAKPFLKIHTKIFPKDFLHESRVELFQKPDIWYKVYNITTIGHEYGHILWIDDDSESKMNTKGAFKNIEEFKATTGGLVAFFENEDKDLSKSIFRDIIKRAVGLISWRETPEVQAYYCEGLIHLKGLFETKALVFDKTKLLIDFDKYEKLKEWYKATYKELAKHYIQKLDASEFLNKYAIKVDKTYDAIDEEVNAFVQYYWRLYKDIGQVVDDSISKEDYL